MKVGTALTENERVSRALEDVAELLEAQEANPYRVQAYRTGAAVVRRLDSPVSMLLDEGGPAALEELHGIGTSLARTIEQLVRTGRLGMLERMRGDASGPEALLATVPGLGPALAHRIHETLGVDDLHELEVVAWDGRLARVPGLGPRRVRAVRECLAARLGRSSSRPVRRAPGPGDIPPVAELLDVDAEYRAGITAGTLPRIAPRRFNPEGERWLPVLHTRRGDRHYTALFSNTPRAHELGKTRDWVVIYRDDHGGGGQWTVVTEHRGERGGQRVVRGREEETPTTC